MPEIRHLVYFSHRIIFRAERNNKRVVIHLVCQAPGGCLRKETFPIHNISPHF
jgi:hypothetical protein